MNILIFSIGAALGAPIRFWIDNKFRPQYKFPVGIFIVNIVGAFVISAIVTPPDVLSQLLLAVPMTLLYELGLLIARFYVPKSTEDAEVSN